MNYQTIYVKNMDAAKRYIQDTIDGQAGFRVVKMAVSLMLRQDSITVLCVSVNRNHPDAIDY